MRRSSRLAAKRGSRLANAEMQAQNVLIKKLGFANPREPVGADAIVAYCRPFKEGGGVPASKFEALRELLPAMRWDEVDVPVASDLAAV